MAEVDEVPGPGENGNGFMNVISGEVLPMEEGNEESERA